MTTSRLVRLTLVGGGIALTLATMYTLIYYFVTARYIAPPPVIQILSWLTIVMAPWVVTAPLAVWVGERWSSSAINAALLGLAHVLFAFVVIGVHMLWYWFWAELMAPYPHLHEDAAALNQFLRYHATAHLLLYGSIVMLSARETSLGLRATPEGLLRGADVHHRGVSAATTIDPGIAARPTPVIVYDPKSLSIRAVNEAAVDCYGYSSAEFKRLSVENIIESGDLSVLSRQTGAGPEVALWTHEATHRRASGELFPVEYIAGNVVFSGRSAMLLIVRDITDKARAREALIASERSEAELRVQLVDAQLRALKLQLKPHFLFNILNTVAMMIRSGETAKAQSVVSLLGEMFRRFLEFENHDKTTLQQELAFLDLYLGLEQYRFEDRVELRKTVDPAVLETMVPTLILQPIAENAVKHGLARIAGRCQLDVNAFLDGDDLVIEVINDAPESAAVRGLGIGLENTRARLAASYGDRAKFSLTASDGRMTAMLRLPQGDPQ